MTGLWTWQPRASGRVFVDMRGPQGEGHQPDSPSGTQRLLLLRGPAAECAPLPFLPSPHSLYLISPNPVKHAGR